MTEIPSTDQPAANDPALAGRLIRLLGQHTSKDCTAWTSATTLEEIGLDSFDFIEFVFLLEDEFGIEIEYNHNDSAKRFVTIGDVAQAVGAVLAAKSAAGAAPAIDGSKTSA